MLGSERGGRRCESALRAGGAFPLPARDAPRAYCAYPPQAWRMASRTASCFGTSASYVAHFTFGLDPPEAAGELVDAEIAPLWRRGARAVGRGSQARRSASPGAARHRNGVRQRKEEFSLAGLRRLRERRDLRA